MQYNSISVLLGVTLLSSSLIAGPVKTPAFYTQTVDLSIQIIAASTAIEPSQAYTPSAKTFEDGTVQTATTGILSATTIMFSVTTNVFAATSKRLRCHLSYSCHLHKRKLARIFVEHFFQPLFSIKNWKYC